MIRGLDIAVTDLEITRSQLQFEVLYSPTSKAPFLKLQHSKHKFICYNKQNGVLIHYDTKYNAVSESVSNGIITINESIHYILESLELYQDRLDGHPFNINDVTPIASDQSTTNNQNTNINTSTTGLTTEKSSKSSMPISIMPVFITLPILLVIKRKKYYNNQLYQDVCH